MNWTLSARRLKGHCDKQNCIVIRRNGVHGINAASPNHSITESAFFGIDYVEGMLPFAIRTGMYLPRKQTSETMIVLTPLQFGILDGMVDDYENVEQLYLMLQPEFPLSDIVDGITALLRLGFVEIKHSDDERTYPVNPANVEMIHHFWFNPTSAGRAAWEAYRAQSST